MGYDNNLRLLEIATGAESGTWGTKTNTNLGLIADAFGSGTEAITTNADTHTTTVADGAADEGRAFFLKYTGTLDSACTITLAPNDINKLWIIENATSGSQNIIINQGISAGSGGKITIGNGKIAAVYTDGSGDNNAAVLDAFADLELSSTLTVAGNVDFNGALDVDGTTNLDAVDIDGAVQVDSTITVGADDTGYDVKFFGDTASAYMLWDTSTDDLVLAGAAGIDLAGDIDVDGTANLDIVDIDGAVDMASTLTLAGNADFNGDLDVDGTTNLDVVDIDGAVDMASTLTLGGTLTVNSGAVFNEASADVDFRVESNGQPGMFFVDGGNDRVGIKTSTPSALLDIGDATNTYSGDMIIKDSGNGGLFITDDTKYLGFWATHDGSSLASSTLGTRSNHALSLMTNDTKALTIDTSQNVGIGTTTPDAHLEISAADNAPTIKFSESDDTNKMLIKFASDVGEFTVVPDKVLNFKNNNTTRMSIAVGGAVNVAGAFSKGSGSFRIDHPLPDKKDTHHLVHSFIEGPKADLIYRGSVDLSGGYAQVDLDDAAGMTEGTWELLCRDPQCWIQNDTGWSAVRGSVETNSLSISCEDATSDDTVSWMVVAERCDPHIMETGWTDDDGRVIVEPEKPEPEEEEE